MVISNFNFYYLADYSHNPNRGVVWTPAYLDPAGQGWLVSAVVPIYNSNFLEGVTGVDISLDSMVKEIERLMLPFNGESFLVDEQGRMISMSSGTQNLLNLQQLSKGVEGQKVHRDTEQPEEFLINRLPYSSFRDTISNMFSYDERTKFAEHDGVTYLIASHPISETGWTLFSITNADKVLIRINELDKMSREFGIMAISLMILFYLLFYYIVQRQSQVLSNKIAEPLGDLSNNVKSAARARRLQSIHSSGIEEVEDLTNNLTSMVAELNKQADNINRSHQRLNEEISYRERLEQQVGTDEVTHLLNRRGLLQQGEIVLQQAVKMRQPMSMLLFEISGYPQIIEQHGSQEAEQVLLQCAECCRALAPDHALMAHLSTAQFVAILPNTAREQAINLSRRIRSEIYLTVELGGSAATVSTHFAVTEAALSHYESLLVMIDRSQQLLERSRRNRNLVIETDSKTE
nr:diguanylate cyclase [Echinimonas agarilytica]